MTTSPSAAWRPCLVSATTPRMRFPSITGSLNQEWSR